MSAVFIKRASPSREGTESRRRSAVPEDNWKSGQWNAFVVMGRSKEERRTRLNMVPDKYRAGVENHVRTNFAIAHKKGR